APARTVGVVACQPAGGDDYGVHRADRAGFLRNPVEQRNHGLLAGKRDVDAAEALARRVAQQPGQGLGADAEHIEVDQLILEPQTLRLRLALVQCRRPGALDARADQAAEQMLHSARMPFSRISFAHLSCSVAIHFAPSSEDTPGAGSMPSTRIRSWMAASASTRRTLPSTSLAMPSGVFAGSIRKYPTSTSKPGYPDSPTVGTAGNCGARAFPETASATNLPDLTCGSTPASTPKPAGTCPAM